MVSLFMVTNGLGAGRGKCMDIEWVFVFLGRYCRVEMAKDYECLELGEESLM